MPSFQGGSRDDKNPICMSRQDTANGLKPNNYRGYEDNRCHSILRLSLSTEPSVILLHKWTML